MADVNIELKGEVVDLGDTPVVLARSQVQFREFCHAHKLRPSRVRYGMTPRTLEGLRPTSVVYLPGFSAHPDYMQVIQVLDRVVAKGPRPLPVHYLTEDEALGR